MHLTLDLAHRLIFFLFLEKIHFFTGLLQLDGAVGANFAPPSFATLSTPMLTAAVPKSVWFCFLGASARGQAWVPHGQPQPFPSRSSRASAGSRAGEGVLGAPGTVRNSLWFQAVRHLLCSPRSDSESQTRRLWQDPCSDSWA